MGVVRWSDEAERDLVEILDFIAQQNPAAADRMQALFSQAVKNLRDHPLIYREGRVSGTREIVVHPNYVLIYRIGAGGLQRVEGAAHVFGPASDPGR